MYLVKIFEPCTSHFFSVIALHSVGRYGMKYEVSLGGLGSEVIKGM